MLNGMASYDKRTQIACEKLSENPCIANNAHFYVKHKIMSRTSIMHTPKMRSQPRAPNRLYNFA